MMVQLAMRQSARRTSAPRSRRAERNPRSVRGEARAGDGVRLWIRLTVPGVGLIGPGKIELLRQIREQQSISAAARAMKMSYRRAWLLVEELNAMFALPVVVTWTGGRSRGGAALTPTGEKLVSTYESVVERAESASRDVLDELRNLSVHRKA